MHIVAKFVRSLMTIAALITLYAQTINHEARNVSKSSFITPLHGLGEEKINYQIAFQISLRSRLAQVDFGARSPWFKPHQGRHQQVTSTAQL